MVRVLRCRVQHEGRVYHVVAGILPVRAMSYSRADFAPSRELTWIVVPGQGDLRPLATA